MYLTKLAWKQFQDAHCDCSGGSCDPHQHGFACSIPKLSRLDSRHDHGSFRRGDGWSKNHRKELDYRLGS